jgi:hypothetical protein
MEHRRYRLFLRNSWTLATTVIGLACADDAVRVTAPPSVGPPPSQAQPVSLDPTEPVATPRVDVTLSASGSFRPNTPVELHAVATAARNARSASVELVLVDGDASAAGRGNTDGTRGLGTATRAMVRGSSATVLDRTVTFSKSGYYRVLARVTADRGVRQGKLRRATPCLSTQ